MRFSAWGAVNIPNEIDNVCPYEQGEYLDVAKHKTFLWPVNKNLPLWSDKENDYSSSCDVNFGYINDANIFVVGASLSSGDCITITMEDANHNIYTCDVNFTEANTENIGDDFNLSLDIGYEWWCFEDAYLEKGYENLYILYYNEECVRSGIDSFEFTDNQLLFLYQNKDKAIENFLGKCYKITDFQRLPSWAKI